MTNIIVTFISIPIIVLLLVILAFIAPVLIGGIGLALTLLLIASFFIELCSGTRKRRKT